LARAKGWDEVFLEGKSEEVISLDKPLWEEVTPKLTYPSWWFSEHKIYIHPLNDMMYKANDLARDVLDMCTGEWNALTIAHRTGIPEKEVMGFLILLMRLDLIYAPQMRILQRSLIIWPDEGKETGS